MKLQELTAKGAGHHGVYLQLGNFPISYLPEWGGQKIEPGEIVEGWFVPKNLMHRILSLLPTFKGEVEGELGDIFAELEGEGMPQYEDVDQIMIKTETGTFRCSCRCNVFTKIRDIKSGQIIYRCNSCRARYMEDKDTDEK